MLRHSAWVIEWILTVLAWKCYRRPKSVFQTAFDLFRPVVITRQCLRRRLKRNFDTKRFFSRRQSRHPKCISLPIPMSNSVTGKDGDYVLASMPTRIIASPRYIHPISFFWDASAILSKWLQFNYTIHRLPQLLWHVSRDLPGQSTGLENTSAGVTAPGKVCFALPGFSGDVRRCQGEKLRMRLMRDCFR